ncbi:MAG: TIGR02099 family protein [Burkholderiales bacterium]|nr:TIGR02099 family protein [Burkholderiales bacterium]
MTSETSTPELLLAPRERRWYRAARVIGWVLVACYFAAALAMLGLRFYLLPRVSEYRAEVAELVSASVGARVEIGAIEAEWFALHPRLVLSNVRVYDPRGGEALVLPYVGATIAWRSILYMEPRFRSLVLDRPELRMRRDADGRFFIAGLALRLGLPESGRTTIADWVLGQDEILIREASLEWTDELRGAPPLRFDHVSFALESDGARRRFAFRAHPPREQAAPLDVRGDLSGTSAGGIDGWRGRLYVASDYIDLAAWRPWIDYPVDVTRGRGALKAWLGFDGRQLTEVTLDAALADVAARLAPDLSPLELASMQGRFGVREVRRAADLFDFLGRHDVRYEGFAQRVALATRSGATLPPTDFTVRWDPDEAGGPPRGEFSARSLELTSLAYVAEHVPLPARARHALADIAPRGRLDDVRVTWTGEVEQPRSFRAQSRFAGLGMQPWAGMPGFAGIGGSVDATERGGTAILDAAPVRVEAPRLFAEPALGFDAMTARVAWSNQADGIEIRLDSLALANADVTARVSGTYRTAPGSPGIVDVTAELGRIVGPSVYRYIPMLGPTTRGYLQRAIRAGTVASAQLTLRGDLKDFPFRAGTDGVFRIAGRATGATVAYAEGWPEITGVDGEIELTGPGLQIRVERGSVLGARIGPTLAAIPDTFHDERLHVEGTATGPTGEFLRFIEVSPVNQMIGRFTEGWRAEGPGKLALRIDMPFDRIAATKVAGSFELADNRIAPGLEEPALARTNGTVTFTEAGVAATDIRAQVFGGPLAFGFATREDGAVALSGQGTFDASALARENGWPLAERLQGNAAYQLRMTYHGRIADVAIESDLAGVTLDLPPPLAKSAGERWPSRLERTSRAAPDAAGRPVRRDTVSLAIGAQVSATAQLREIDGGLALERAAVGVGGVAAALPREPGVLVAVNVPDVDLDRFRALLPQAAGEGAGERKPGEQKQDEQTPGARQPATEGRLPLAVSVRAGALTALGRRFNDVTVRAQQKSDGWQAQVKSREVTGDLAWRSEGRGSLVARLSRLALPEPVPGASRGRLSELPALDVVADSLVDDDRDLGKLSLVAVNAGEDWRIERLLLAAPDGSISAEGRWRPAGPAAELTDMRFKIATADAGAYLTRFGFPGALARGTATLEGRLAWAGPPYDLDYVTLAGDIALKAEKGQFLKIEPGLGKLLGVLSLQSLPRRITLDFRDVFSAGFAFDTITANARIAGGVMTTDDFVMIGPSAAVTMKGRTDIARETQDLQLRVVPDVGSGVAAAAGIALLNPLIGAGTLLAQALLKNPIGQMLAYEYIVTGTWGDPKVTKVAAADGTAPSAPN